MENRKISLLDNSRFYVLAFTACLSLAIFFFLRTVIVDDRLRYIRLQQIYGLCAVLYWYLLLLMAPASKLIGKRSWLPPVLFTRRALGVSVAYFALLHFYIGLTQQLKGWHGIWILPASFKWAILFGFIALSVLVFMAALSVDKFTRLIRFKQWKLLSRVSYAAGLLIIVHIWLIGTHMTYIFLQVVGLQALALLFGLEAARIGVGMKQKKTKTWLAVTTGLLIWIVLTGGLLAMKFFVPSEGDAHRAHVEAGAEIHAH